MSIIGKIARMRRMRANFTAVRPTPECVAINITGVCNLSCAFCEKSRDGGGDSLGEEQVMELAALAARLGAALYFGGGEPMMHPGFWSILESVGTLGVDLSISTNGTRLAGLTSERHDLLARVVDTLLISVDDGSPQAHDQGRGRPGVHDGITAYLTGQHRRPPVVIVSVLRPDLANIPGLLDFAAAHNVPIVFQMMITASNFPLVEPLAGKQAAAQEMRGNADLVEPMVREFAARAQALGVRTNLQRIADHIGAFYRSAGGAGYFGVSVLPRYVCSVPYQRLIVDEHGQIQPCALLSGARTVADGDVLETWREQALGMRERLMGGESFPPCSACACHVHDNYLGSMLFYPGANRAAWVMEGRRWLMRRRVGIGRKPNRSDLQHSEVTQ